MKKIIIPILCFFIFNHFIEAQSGLFAKLLLNGKDYDNNYILCKDSCYDLTLSIIGGTPPYKIKWNSFNDTNAVLKFCTPNILFTGNPLYNISVTVTDANHYSYYGPYSPFRITLPFHQEICIVTVDSTKNKNMIIWEKGTDTITEFYNIYKETTETGIYKIIAKVLRQEMSIYIDTTSEPSKFSSRYCVKAANICNESYSIWGDKTAHLTINKGLNNSINLIWENYSGGSGSGSKNRIWRGLSKNTMKLIDSVSTSSTTYSDYNPPQGILYYVLEYVPQNKCNPSKKDGKSNYSTSFSNIVDNKTFLGIDDVKNSDNLIKILPNPTNDWTIISYELSARSKVKLSVYDVMGRKQLTMDNGQLIMENAGKHTISFDIRNLKSGVYFVKLETESDSRVEKLIVSH